MFQAVNGRDKGSLRDMSLWRVSGLCPHSHSAHKVFRGLKAQPFVTLLRKPKRNTRENRMRGFHKSPTKCSIKTSKLNSSCR